jgi:hypothetical protein
MTHRLLPLALGAAVAVLTAGAATWGYAQQGAPDVTAPAPPPAAPAVAPAPPKPKEAAKPKDEAAPVAAKPADTAASDDTSDGDNPEVASAAPKAKPAAAKPVEPEKRPRYPVAVIQALDKVTAQTVRFEAPVGRAVRYKSLIFIVHACETTAADEASPDAIAHIEIDAQPPAPDGQQQQPARQVFRGWMFASSPGLNLLEHPIYDAWLIACKTAGPSA